MIRAPGDVPTKVLSGRWLILILLVMTMAAYFAAHRAWPTLTHHRPTGRTAGMAFAAAMLVGVLVPRFILAITAWWEFTRSTDYRMTETSFSVSWWISGFLGTVSALTVAPWLVAGSARVTAGPFGAWPEKLAWATLVGAFVLLLMLIVTFVPQGWPTSAFNASPGWTKLLYPITIPFALVLTGFFALFKPLRWARKPFLALWLFVVGREIIAFTTAPFAPDKDSRHLYFPERYAMNHSFRPNGTLHALRYPILFEPVTTALQGWVQGSLRPFEPWYHCGPLLVFIAYFGAMYGLGAVIVYLFWRMLRAFAR